MSNTAKRWLKSGVAMLLALCMVLGIGLVAPTAQAASSVGTSGIRDVNGDGKINYVAFGDSVTNGYGMEGYRYEDGGNMVGFKREVETAYPYMVMQHLKNQGFTVDLEQLAISGFRMDELHCMLDESFVGDDYHYKYFNSWFDNLVSKWKKYEPDDYYSKYKDGQDTREVIRNEYTTAVKKADLITIDLGTNNFGTFMTNQLQLILGIGGLPVEMDFTQFLDARSYATMDAMLGNMVANMVGASSGQAYELAKTLAQTLMYGYLGFTTHYDAAIEKIYELNPNAQVVVIDVYSMMSGVKMTGETFGSSIDLGQLYGTFIDLANLYTRELSPWAAKVTHVSMNTDPELFFDYYADYPDSNYPNNQYLHPTAERLMNEFIMEALGYDADDPASREQFSKEVLSGIQALDGYVNNLQATVEKEVIGLIVDGVQTAADAVDTAIEGIELIQTAVDYVPKAQSMVDMVVEKVVGNSLFSTDAKMKNLIVSVIKSEVAGMDLSSIGFDTSNAATQDLLAEEIYTVACIYKNELDNGGTAESANKKAVIEVLRFVLVEKMGYSEAEASALAEQAYNVNALYQKTLAETHSEKEATIACMVQVGGVDKATAELGYTLYTNVYQAALNSGADKAAARKQTIIVAIQNSNSKYAGEGIAEAMYNIHAAATDSDAATVPAEADVIKALATEGIDEATAKAIYACYTQDLDGQPTNPNVKTTMIFLMMKAMGMDQATAADQYDMYLTYKQMPTTLSKISKNKTIYIDYLLKGGINLDAVAKGFMDGSLSLDNPGKDASQAEIDKFRSDSSLAILYMRFMSQDGVFIHPSEAGQNEMTSYIKSALTKLNTAADEDVVDASGKTILTIGDSIAAGKEGQQNFTQLVAEALGTTATNISYNGLRINELRAALDGSYAGDAYTAAVLPTAAMNDYAAALKAAIPANDIILVNMGAMNMGFAAAQLQKFTAGQGTYAMKFSNVDNMDPRNLGATMDALLTLFETDSVDAASQMMLAFESYGYGFTTFADCFDAAITAIKALNPDATIVLVGQYDLLGKSYVEAGSMYLAYGEFIKHATDLMNGYMENYAEMTENVIYVDVTGTETLLGSETLNLAASGKAAEALEKAHPTANGQKQMAAKIACALGGHTVKGDVTFKWAEDYSSAKASFHCSSCGKDVTVNAVITAKNSATCTEDGTITYTATATISGKTYTDTKTKDVKAGGHTYGEPTWTWSDDYATASASFSCTVCDAEPTVVKATVSNTVTEGTCTETGAIVYTAAAEFGGKTYTDTKTQETPAVGHTYGEPTWTWSDDFSVAKAALTCSVCKTVTEADAVITSETIAPTCDKDGTVTYTAVATVSGKEYTDTKVRTLPAAHSYVDGVCSVCGATTENGYIYRLSGKTRYETSLKTADALKEVLKVETFDTVIVASGTNFADALAGSYLAAVKNAPILITNAEYAPMIQAYIAENLTEDGTVYILGGSAAVPETFEQGLAKTYTVKRLKGANRYVTNLEILKEAGVADEDILVCTGLDFADSLSASALGKPILLVRDSLSDAQEAFLENLDGDNKFFIIGGSAAVSNDLAAEISVFGATERLSGKTRLETSAMLADRFFQSPKAAVLAYDRNFPDGLCGGPLAYALNAPLILTQTNSESAAAAYTAEKDITRGYVLGGTKLISDASARKIFQADADLEVTLK